MKQNGQQVPCAHCGNLWYRQPNQARAGRLYCSRRCRYAADRVPVGDRFWDKVDQSGECWLWQAGRTPKGYGMVKVNGAHQGAHRVAYELVNGPIPAGMLVCHRCDTPACVRPDHLFLGSAKTNNRDAIAKGRRPQNLARAG